MINFLDTSAILNDGLNLYPNCYISPITLLELEHIKGSNEKSQEIKYKARQAVNKIINSLSIEVCKFPTKQIDKVLKQYNYLFDINDHKILCSAILLSKKEQVKFITSDGAQFLFAKNLNNITPQFLEATFNILPEYNGWNDYHPTEEILAKLYSNLNENILNCNINEFAKIYHDNELKDILFWNGKQYRTIKYKEFTAPTGERIRPRNLEQKIYLDLLQNDEVPIKLCVGHFGTGKSMFAETWATYQLTQGKYDKIIFVKNNLEVKGAGKLGILPGDELQKQYPWLRQLEDHLGPQLFEEYLASGQIEPAHLSTLRGRDLRNCLILVDEAENLLTTNIQLLLGRVAEGSQIIFCADIKQCDYKNEKDSGISDMINKLKGHPLFGMVKLIKTERSKVAAVADLLD